MKDTDPFALPINGLSDGINVRFDNGRIVRQPVFRTFNNTVQGLTGGNIGPMSSYGVYNAGGYDSVFYVNAAMDVYNYANYSTTVVSPAGWAPGISTEAPYTWAELSQVIYLNRQGVQPIACPIANIGTANVMTTLPFWGMVPGTSLAQYVVSFSGTTMTINSGPLPGGDGTTTALAVGQYIQVAASYLPAGANTDIPYGLHVTAGSGTSWTVSATVPTGSSITVNTFLGTTAQQGWSCRALRPYNSFLVYLNLTTASASYPTMVGWSDAVQLGRYPDSWDYTDPSVLAGQNPLSQATTEIVDGLTLGQSFAIYTHDECWMMTYLGDGFEFQFQRCPYDKAGVINNNCMVELNGNHVVFGQYDIYMHNGIQKQSIIEGRNREQFFNNINIKNSQDCAFVALDKDRNQIIFACNSGDTNAALPQADTSYCNFAAVWNYVTDTWSFMDLPGVTATCQANANTVWTYADIDPTVGDPGCPNPALTYANVGGTYFDQQDSYSRYCMFSAPANTTLGNTSSIYALDDPNFGRLAQNVDTLTVQTAWVQRLGFPMDAEGAPLRSYKHIRAMIPMISLTVPNSTLSCTLGAQLTSAAPPTWDPPFAFNPAADYLINTRQGGRYLAYEFELTAPNFDDFSVTGFDLDVVVTGQR